VQTSKKLSGQFLNQWGSFGLFFWIFRMGYGVLVNIITDYVLVEKAFSLPGRL